MSALYGIVVVGTSWGGLAALRTLMAGLPADLPLPVVVIQHRHRQSDNVLPQLLQDRTGLRVCEVEDKTPIEPGAVFVAPADYHLLIEPEYFTLSVEEPIRYSRPSIDLSFASAADTFGARTIGVVLTGANADGAEGLQRIVERGGLAIVQDPATAESSIMPAAALKAVPTARVMRLEEMADFIGRQARLDQATPSSRAFTMPPEVQP